MLPRLCFWVIKNLCLLTTGRLNYFINGKFVVVVAYFFGIFFSYEILRILNFMTQLFRSVTLVTGCSILVSSNQLFGDPIQCDLVKDFFP